MKICLLGKYPPIEGGVSAQTYWLARGLAQRGHEIHVVTNADEVEETFRLTLEDDDASWYQPQFDHSRGRVRVYNTERFSARTMSHIPVSNPFVSKLASLATDVVRRHECEIILAYYYEPYGVAGSLVSHWTKRPLIAKHAGSDLDRLFGVLDLATTYKEVLRSAAGVVTQHRLMPRFLGMGIPSDRLQPDIPFSVPTDVFNENAAPLDVERAARLIHAGEQRSFNSQIPSIGLYGKIGWSKGTFDLISALGILARDGLEFNFLAMVGAAQGESLKSPLRDVGLMERTWILPMLPNWKVPSFIRACTAVCFLEREFPVAIHGPMIPREVLACGTPLILSEEIADKQRYRKDLENGRNVLIVKDPQDHEELAAVVKSVLVAPKDSQTIGKQGLLISRSLEDHNAYSIGWEEVLTRHVDNARGALPLETPLRETTEATADQLDLTVPELVSFLRRRDSRLVETFLKAPAEGNLFEVAIGFCDFATEHLGSNGFSQDLPKILAAIRYMKSRLIAAHDVVGKPTPAFFITDRLQGQPVTQETVWELRPVRGNSIRIEVFDYDVSSVFPPLAYSSANLADSFVVDLETIRAEPMIILFQRSANLVSRELQIDEATKELLNRCDGNATTRELVDHMYQYFGTGAAKQRREVTAQVLSALDRLYRASAIVFGERKPGWGWTGGERGADNGSFGSR